MSFRVIAITFGGYGLTSALCALFGIPLFYLGMSMPDAMLTTVLFGYLFYIAMLMWAFADRESLKRPCIILIAAAVTMTITSVLAPLVLES